VICEVAVVGATLVIFCCRA